MKKHHLVKCGHGPQESHSNGEVSAASRGEKRQEVCGFGGGGGVRDGIRSPLAKLAPNIISF